MKCIKTYDKQEFMVTDEQAEKLYQLSLRPNPPAMVDIDGQMIALSNISSVVDVLDSQETPAMDKPLLAEVKPQNDNQALWLEVIRMNRELLLKNKLPVWTLVDGEIVQQEYYWRDSPAAHDQPMTFEWCKVSVPNNKTAFYAASPGYTLLEKQDKRSVYAFKRATNTLRPSHIEILNPMEVKKVSQNA